MCWERDKKVVRNKEFYNIFFYFQQQMHAQQIPGAPPQPMPSLGALGPLGAFAGPMGLPHGPQSLLKAPQDLHREDIKIPVGGPSSDERLVGYIMKKLSEKKGNTKRFNMFLAHKFSITR